MILYKIQLVFIFHESDYMVEFLTASAECLSILLCLTLFWMFLLI